MNEQNFSTKVADWLSEQQCHPLRYDLTEELHARPFESLQTPADIFLFAKFTGEESRDNEFSHLQNFCQQHQLATPKVGVRHHRMYVGDDLIRWERHGEFTTFSLITSANSEQPFDAEVSSILLDWMSNTEGQILVATQLSIREYNAEAHTEENVVKLFNRASLVSSKLASEEAKVWTDLRIHESGFNRILLLNDKLRNRKLGRVAQRLMNISTYRNLALLALPIAQKASHELADLDRQLSILLDELSIPSDYTDIGGDRASRIELDSKMLRSLTALSMQIQSLSTQSRYRLSAADAYYALINSRLTELNETRVIGFQTIGEFLQRRLSPAMRTCTSVQGRLEDLSNRTSRAVDLLRTRLDLTLEHQNHSLLESMNKRVLAQMRLQQTVEGLSIAAITYYIISLIGYLTKSTDGLASQLGLSISPEVITGLSVLPVGFLVWYSVRRIKRKILEKTPN